MSILLLQVIAGAEVKHDDTAHGKAVAKEKPGPSKLPLMEEQITAADASPSQTPPPEPAQDADAITERLASGLQILPAEPETRAEDEACKEKRLPAGNEERQRQATAPAQAKPCMYFLRTGTCDYGDKYAIALSVQANNSTFLKFAFLQTPPLRRSARC